MSDKIRVLILGGGCAGMSTAWGLSSTEALRARFEVTVVQAGWRLGGKGATGRSARHGQRVHEHGLHIWMGFYDNAFRMAKAAYDAWTPPPGCPISTIEQAFSPHYTMSLFDREGRPAHLGLPPRPGKPWDAPGERSASDGELARWLRREGLVNLTSFLRDISGAEQSLRTLARLGKVIVRGLLRDVFVGGSWEALDDWDLCAWLAHHGADGPEVWDAPPIRAFYNLAFAYPDGRAGFGRGALAAGPALRALLRMMFTYRGAPMWKMNAGMGDTIFVPLFEVMRDRGVRFDFFRRVANIETDGRAITAVALERQAQLAGPTYEPLVELPEQGLRVWPDAPLVDQLVQIADGDLEGDAPGAVGLETRRVGEDFDAVVLAIPVPAHASIASELIEASDRFRAMVAHHASVVTIAAQIWTSQTLEELGWDGPSTISTNGGGLMGSWADMSEVLRHEAWPGDVKTLLYFVDTAPEEWFEGMDRAEAAALVRDRARAAFEASRHRFPAIDEPALAAAPGSDDKLACQYYRANIAASERYILTPPGTVRYRLAPDDSGFANLWLAGDWTRTSINGGSVEAAVESGRVAAEAIERQAVAVRRKGPVPQTPARGTTTGGRRWPGDTGADARLDLSGRAP